MVLHAGNALDAAGDEHLALACDHALRGHRDRLQARRAETIDGRTGHAHRQARAQCNLARDVAAARTFGPRAADQHVLDFIGCASGSLDRVRDDVAAERRAVGHVECALPALGECGARGGDDDGLCHEGSLI